MLKAVVMAGGKGTRLRPFTEDCPKPMVPVANRPVLEHIIHLLKANGFEEIILTTCYLPGQFRQVFGDGSRYGVSLGYSYEAEPLGTAGGVRMLTDALDDTFLVISGDCLTDFDLVGAVRWHKEKNADATLIVTEVEDPTAYGIVARTEEGRIERFLEKPQPNEVFSNTVNTGIYVLEPGALRAVPEGVAFDFSRDLFPRLLNGGRPLYAYKGEGYWSDIGSCDQYIQAQSDVLTGKVRLPSLEDLSENAINVDPKARIYPGAHLVAPVVIGAGAIVEEGARVGPCAVLGPKCRVMPGAVVEHSVVWEESYIGPGARVSGAAIGRHAVLEERASLTPGATLGHRARLGVGGGVTTAVSRKMR